MQIELALQQTEAKNIRAVIRIGNFHVNYYYIVQNNHDVVI